ncbi:MAG: hypothetical protein KatS3mg111_4322 [Pirellulaceae bacterium]|nr:MAG: hypothetical protein KatS3mg111_4322 [Pirellulaceae bacterium]
MQAAVDVIPIERATAPYFFGIDVGGTNIKIGLVDDRGQTLAVRKHPHAGRRGTAASS